MRVLNRQNEDELPAQMDQSRWPEMKKMFAEVFGSKTREEWFDWQVRGR